MTDQDGDRAFYSINVDDLTGGLAAILAADDEACLSLLPSAQETPRLQVVTVACPSQEQ